MAGERHDIGGSVVVMHQYRAAREFESHPLHAKPMQATEEVHMDRESAKALVAKLEAAVERYTECVVEASRGPIGHDRARRLGADRVAAREAVVEALTHEVKDEMGVPVRWVTVELDCFHPPRTGVATHHDKPEPVFGVLLYKVNADGTASYVKDSDG